MLDFADAIARYERASPLLLAMEQATAPDIAPVDDFDWTKLREHAESRVTMARSWRFSWVEHWALIAQYLHPRRSLWLSQGGIDQPVQAPELPTLDEAGLPGFYASFWNGFWVPKGTPEAVIARLNGAVVDALADPDVSQHLINLGFEIPSRAANPGDFEPSVKI